MANYLLTVFCDEPSSKVENIIEEIKPIINCKRIKWFSSDKNGSILIHFTSEENPNDVKELIYLTIFHYSTFFYMTEMTENTMFGMTQENMEHLLNINDEKVDLEKNPTIEQIEEALMEFDCEEEIDPEIMALKMINTVKNNTKKPSLNELLDRISENGFESLSKYEKEILNSYSIN